MTAASLSLAMIGPDIARITFDTPDKRVNLLSSSVLDELETLLNQVDRLHEQQNVAGLVIRSGKPETFIVGADLQEFVEWQSQADHKARMAEFSRRGQSLFSRLASSPYVTVAAIDGICLGGGAELGTWCDRRILTTNAKVGFPEVTLGLIPGWGGCVRLPCIVGLENAVKLIIDAQSIDAERRDR